MVPYGIRVHTRVRIRVRTRVPWFVHCVRTCVLLSLAPRLRRSLCGRVLHWLTWSAVIPVWAHFESEARMEIENFLQSQVLGFSLREVVASIDTRVCTGFQP